MKKMINKYKNENIYYYIINIITNMHDFKLQNKQHFSRKTFQTNLYEYMHMTYEI